MKNINLIISFAVLFLTATAASAGNAPPPVVVPEPSVLGLLGLGVVALFIFRRKSK